MKLSFVTQIAMLSEFVTEIVTENAFGRRLSKVFDCLKVCTIILTWTVPKKSLTSACFGKFFSATS